MTWDILKVTCDMRPLEDGEYSLKPQLPISYVFGNTVFEDHSTKDECVRNLMNDKGVCRTAPDKPGLLKITSVCARPKIVNLR